MTASDGMKELDDFSFGIKAPERWQSTGFESVLHLIPGIIHCCIPHEKDLYSFDEGNPSNFPISWLTDEIINFYIFWM